MRYAAAILVVTAGLVAGLWLHGLKVTRTQVVVVAPTERVPVRGGSIYAQPGVKTEYVPVRRHPEWADLAAVAALGTSLALGAVIVTFRR